MATGPIRYGLAWTWFFKMSDATDGFTPEPGVAPAVTLSQDGGAFAALTGPPAVQEIGSGWYYVVLPATDTTFKTGILKATAAGCADLSERIIQDRTAQIHFARIANKVLFDYVAGTVKVYEDDGSTLKRTFTISETPPDVILTPS